mgnify:CR=1 FL=1
MTDASPSGGALVKTSASADQLREEAQWASASGWLVNTLGPERIQAQDLPVPRCLKLRIVRFLHLFSGPPREGDIKWYLEEWSVVSGLLLIIDCIDLEAPMPINVLDPWTASVITSKARVGWWDAGHGGPPCSTWTKAL